MLREKTQISLPNTNIIGLKDSMLDLIENG